MGAAANALKAECHVSALDALASSLPSSSASPEALPNALAEIATHSLAQFDWRSFRVPPVEQWPAGLRAVAGVVLESPVPTVIFLGDQAVACPNRAAATLFRVAGSPVDALDLHAHWVTIEPSWRQVWQTGRALQDPRLALTIDAEHAAPAHFHATYSPVTDAHGTVAVVLTLLDRSGAIRTQQQDAVLEQLCASALEAGPSLASVESILSAAVEDVPCFAILARDSAGAITVLSQSPEGPWATGLVHRSENLRRPTQKVLETPLTSLWSRPIRQVSIHRLPLFSSASAASLAPRALALTDQTSELVLVLGESERGQPDAGRERFARALVCAVAEALDAAYDGSAAYDQTQARDEDNRCEGLTAASGVSLAASHWAAHDSRGAHDPYVLLHDAPMPVWISQGENAVTVHMNRCAASLSETVGLAPVELPMPASTVMAQLFDATHAEAMRRARENGAPVRLASVALSRSTQPQANRYFDVVHQPLYDAQGDCIGVATFGFEVSEAIRSRTAAEEAVRVKDQFLAMLGHELRNPLAPILTATQILRRRQLPGGAGSQELDIIERQVRHMVRLIDDLLDVARITRGDVALERARVDLSDVVRQAVEVAEPLITQRRHRLSIEVPDKTHVVTGDPTRLIQIVGNLLTNAARYTDMGGSIRVTARRHATRCEIAVIDSGVGLSPNMHEAIFGLFVQGQQPLDRPRGGLGLGLPIARSLAEAHGGSLKAASPGHGQGSTFTLSLPWTTDEPIATRLDSPTPLGRSTAPLRVLLVDDNVDAATMLGAALSSMGHSVCIAHDAPEALMLVDRFAPQVALLDIGLPVMNGYQLARQLRRSGRHDALRLAALTGFGQTTDRQQSKEAGFDAHFVKPIDLPTLEAFLAAVLAPALQ